MPARDSEAIVLRTYPFGEADLVASAFTRDLGKIRGVARGVRRPKSRFGSGLERLAHVRLFYFFKETSDLARFDRCDLIGPPVFLRADYPTIAALDFMAEVSDQLLPEHEPNDAYFRLLVLMLEEVWEGVTGKLDPASLNENGLGASLPGDSPKAAKDSLVAPAVGPHAEAPGWLWRALTYFSLWAVRLGGWLPPLDACLQSGEVLEPEQTAYFERSQQGLFTVEFRTRDSWPLSSESRRIAADMLKKPLAEFRGRAWAKSTGEDLRRFLTQRLEAQFESRLKTVGVLAQL